MFGKKEKKSGLFSDTLTGDARAVALTLYITKHDVFATRIYEDAATGEKHWLEAAKSPVTNRWTIMRHQETAQGHYQEPLHSAAMMLFDALHVCASFENIKNISSLPLKEGKQPHYSAVANDHNIPLDKDGFPHPAENGVILTKGFFEQEAYDVAARTKKIQPEKTGTELVVRSLFESQGDFIENAVRKYEAEADLEKRREEWKKAEKPLKLSLENAQELKSFFNKISGDPFKRVRLPVRFWDGYMKGYALGTGSAVLVTAATALAPPVFSVGLLGASAGMVYDRAWKSRTATQFNERHGKLLASAKKLPDGQEKQLVLEFASAAMAAFYLVQATALQNRCARGKDGVKKLRKLQNQGLSLIDQAAAEMKWPKEDVEKLKLVYRAGKFPQAGEFVSSLDSQYKVLSHTLQDALYAVADGEIPAPKPPARPALLEDFQLAALNTAMVGHPVNEETLKATGRPYRIAETFTYALNDLDMTRVNVITDKQGIVQKIVLG